MSIHKSQPAYALADAIHSTAIHLLRRLRIQDLASGIGPAKLSALSVLVFSPRPLSLAELAAAEQVKNPTMSRLVAAMEREGLVHTTSSREDARAIEIIPTKQGERLLLAGKHRRVHSLAKALQDLGDQDLDRLKSSVDLLGEVIRRM